MPPIWGLAHGFWISILYYPLWLFADNMFYAAYSQRSALSIIAAALVFVTLFAATIIFARLSQPFAAHRAASRGISKKDFLYRERIWAIASIVTGVIMLVAATYYNLFIRPSLGA